MKKAPKLKKKLYEFRVNSWDVKASKSDYKRLLKEEGVLICASLLFRHGLTREQWNFADFEVKRVYAEDFYHYAGGVRNYAAFINAVGTLLKRLEKGKLEMHPVIRDASFPDTLVNPWSI